MKSVTMWALVVLNVVLGSALLAKVGRENTAVAQVGRSSDYLFVPGQVVGGSNAVIYMLDMSNGWLGAMTFDPTRSRFDMMIPIKLDQVFDRAQPGGAAPRNGAGGANARPGPGPGGGPK